MKKLLSLVLALLMALSAVTAVAEGKDTLVVTALTSSESFDPHTANEFDRMVVNSVMDTLFMYDENGKPAPCLAESWEENGLDITVHLRQGVSFHDGTPFNADAVLKNYEYELAGEYGALLPTYVSSIDKVDDYTVTLVKASSYASVIDYFCSYFYMASPAAYDADPAGFATHPVGTGAYVFDHRDAATGYVYLTANEDYFQGAPHFKKLEVHTMLDSATALIAMENGELDLCLTPSISDFELASENSALKTGTTTGWTQMTMMLMGEPYRSDINLRKAILYAVNAENAAIYYGMTEPVLSKDMFASAIMRDYSGTVEMPSYDPEVAKQYLAASNYNGETLEINVTSLYEQVAVSVGYDLESIGIKTVINVVDMNTWVSKIFDGTVGITTSPLGGSYGCLEEMLLTFAGQGYYGSLGGLAIDADADAALDKALAVVDAAERFPLTVEAYEKQAALGNMRGLFEDIFHVVYRAELSGVETKWAASGVPYLYKVTAAE